MIEKRFQWCERTDIRYVDEFVVDTFTNKELDEEDMCDLLNELHEENKRLKTQLYCDDEEGVCNTCKHHYLVKDDEVELGYYNSRCKKGHYECARVSLKYCEDFEKELK